MTSTHAVTHKVCQHLFLLDAAVEDGATTATGTVEESPHYSLHTIVGIRVSETLQFRVSLAGVSLITQFDMASTHNFISESAAQQTSLPL